MRSRRPLSHAGMWFVWRRLRFRFVVILVRMWLRLAWPALYLPEAVFRKRLAAPRWVLILGISVSFGLFWPGRRTCRSLLALAGYKPLIPQRKTKAAHRIVNSPANRSRPLCRARAPHAT